jgi:hypothetical protein
MSDILTEELAAIRRIREQRFRELTRDLEERALRSKRESSGADPQEAPYVAHPASPDKTHR